MKLVRGKSGLLAHLGTSDAMEVERRIAAGDEKAQMVYDAMLYTAAKSIGALAAPQTAASTASSSPAALLTPGM